MISIIFHILLQVKFFNFKGTVKRSEFTQKHRQAPWSVFHGIEWDGKIFKTGDLVRLSFITFTSSTGMNSHVYGGLL